MPGAVRHRWLTLAIGVALLLCPVARAQSVLNYHGAPNRNGTYVMPGLTWENAHGIHIDPSFDGHIDGHIYTQPLFWQSPKTHRQLLLVASENDVVYALDAHSGQVVWRKSLGRPVSGSALPCGNITDSAVSVGAASSTPELASDARVALEQPDATRTIEGERKTVTALFADIKGSTELMEDFDPEEARWIIDPAAKLHIYASVEFGFAIKP